MPRARTRGSGRTAPTSTARSRATRTAPADQQLAHFFSTVLFPLADVVVDMHSRRPQRPLPAVVGDALGRRPCPAARDGRRDARLGHRPPLRLHRHRRHRAARRRGGAAGQGRRLDRARRRRPRHRGDAPDRAVGPRERATARRRAARRGDDPRRPWRIIGRATDVENYLLAPECGLWETFVDLGERVDAGQPVGQIHFLERPDREPSRRRARNDGIVFVVRAIATTDQGDNVAVIGTRGRRWRSCY